MTRGERLAQAERDQGGAEALARLALEFLGSNEPTSDSLLVAMGALSDAAKLADNAALMVRLAGDAEGES